VYRRRPLDPLGLEGAVIDPSLNPAVPQALVRQRRPALAPEDDLAGLQVIELACLVLEAVAGQPTGGAKEIGVVIASVPAAAWAVDGHVHRTAMPRRNVMREADREARPPCP